MRPLHVVASLLISTAFTANSACAATAAKEAESRSAIEAAVAAPTRTPANTARDRYRHPAETLNFFGVEPDDTVVEIWPGGGWYTEILASLLSESGTLWTVASERGLGGVRNLISRDEATYGKIRMAAFPAGAQDKSVPNGTADAVLTFRNVHNWVMKSEEAAAEAFRQMYAMLKPGGILGITDHRLPEEADSALEKTSGYVKVSTVMRLAQQAGFRFVGASKVNANPRDTRDHPSGVWSLPPVLREGNVDRDKYLAIGESDRMTLKFVKPE